MGIASNKLVAQIASKLSKPRGFVVVLPGEEAEFMRPLGLGRLPGIGKKTEEELAKAGLRKVSDLFDRSDSELASILGRDWRRLLAQGRGEDESEVETESEDAKSYSKQETFFSDQGDFAEVERVAKRMIDELLPMVRADHAMVRTITVKVRYPDFTQESHGQSIESATDIEATFYPLVGPLLRAAWKKRRPLRLVSVRLSSVEAGTRQLEMFAQADEKRRKLAGVLDKLNVSRKNPVVVHGHQLPRSPKRN
jgi:DNA polymerase-4